ncbi:hypothetical protein D3C72_1291370 [compost metagenome]
MATASIRWRVSSGPRLPWYSFRIGTKACENAPSAKTRRSRLGIRNATLKASVMSEAPKARAIRISRTSPVTRESMVRLLMVASALSRFKMGRESCCGATYEAGAGWECGGYYTDRAARQGQDAAGAYRSCPPRRHVCIIADSQRTVAFRIRVSEHPGSHDVT